LKGLNLTVEVPGQPEPHGKSAYHIYERIGEFMARNERILIVGGGIAGLAAAIALRRRGFAPELVERAASWRAIGTGITIQPNAMRLLRELGVASRLESTGATLRRFQFLNKPGEVLSEIDLTELWSDIDSGVAVERGELQKALLKSADWERCRLGVAVTSLSRREGSVSIGFSDGGSAVYDLAIGADGIGSTVRALAFGATAPQYCGHSAWRAIAPIRRKNTDEVQFWLGDGSFFTTYAVGAERTYGCAYIAEASAGHAPVEGRLAYFRDCFAAFGEPVRALLASLTRDDQIHCSAIESLELPEWRKGRVLLIGDAAHASSPMMGQGGCMAVEDAAVLAELLDTSPNVDAALDAFSPRRRPRVDWVQAQSDALAQSALAPAAARDAVIKEHGAQAFRDRYAPLLLPP
jgi:2-polyprenyl-6-methoxyphenol hydroxylase-like FAD-dependent oxidoreductase